MSFSHMRVLMSTEVKLLHRKDSSLTGVKESHYCTGRAVKLIVCLCDVDTLIVLVSDPEVFQNYQILKFRTRV